MKDFVRALFLIYYRFQTKIGNGDIDKFMSLAMIGWSLFLYLFSASVLLTFLNHWNSSFQNPLLVLTVASTAIALIVCFHIYHSYVRNNDIEDVIAHIQLSRKMNIMAAIFFIGSIIFIGVSFLFMWGYNTHLI